MYRREEGHWPGEPSPFFCSNEIVPLLRREHFCNKPRRIFRKKKPFSKSTSESRPCLLILLTSTVVQPIVSSLNKKRNSYLQIVCLGKPAKDFTFPILSLSKISNLIWFSVPVLMNNSCSQMGSRVFLQTCTIFILKILIYRTSFPTLVSYRWFS